MKQHNPYGIAFTVSLLIGGLGAVPAWADELSVVTDKRSPAPAIDGELTATASFDLNCEDMKESQRQACEDTCRSIEATPEFEEGFCGFGSVCQCSDKGNQTP